MALVTGGARRKLASAKTQCVQLDALGSTHFSGELSPAKSFAPLLGAVGSAQRLLTRAMRWCFLNIFRAIMHILLENTLGVGLL